MLSGGCSFSVTVAPNPSQTNKKISPKPKLPPANRQGWRWQRSSISMLPLGLSLRRISICSCLGQFHFFGMLLLSVFCALLVNAVSYYFLLFNLEETLLWRSWKLFVRLTWACWETGWQKLSVLCTVQFCFPKCCVLGWVTDIPLEFYISYYLILVFF